MIILEARKHSPAVLNFKKKYTQACAKKITCTAFPLYSLIVERQLRLLHLPSIHYGISGLLAAAKETISITQNDTDWRKL